MATIPAAVFYYNLGNVNEQSNKRVRYVLGMYSNLPDELHGEISSFLGYSFKKVLTNVDREMKKDPYAIPMSVVFKTMYCSNQWITNEILKNPLKLSFKDFNSLT